MNKRDTNEMPKLLANWLLTSKSYDTDTDDDSTVASDSEWPYDVRHLSMKHYVFY